MERTPNPTGCFLRILSIFTCIAFLVYGNYDNAQMLKVKAELVALGITGGIMALHTYWCFAWLTQWINPKRKLFYSMRLPYNYVAVIATDILSIAGCCVAIVLLAYWDRRVVYNPMENDPEEWLACHRAPMTEPTIVVTPGLPVSTSSQLSVLWCEVIVDGQHRLIGNSSARQQLHILIGLASGLLFLELLTLTWVLLVGNVYGFWSWSDSSRTKQPDMETSGKQV